MFSLTNIGRFFFADIIDKYANGSLSESACKELAFFLQDTFVNLSLDRFQVIVDQAHEYESLDELIYGYFNKEEIDEFKKECEEEGKNFEVAIRDKIQEDFSCTILQTDEGYLVIE